MASRLTFVLILLALPVLEAQVQVVPFLLRFRNFLKGFQAGSNANNYAEKSHNRGPGYIDTVTSSSEFTLFWPTDEAFSRLPANTLQSLTDEDKQQIIYAHTVPSYITFSSDSSWPVTLETLVPGVSITIDRSVDSYSVSSAQKTGIVLGYYPSYEYPRAGYAINTVLYVPTSTIASSTQRFSGRGFLLGVGVACFGFRLCG